MKTRITTVFLISAIIVAGAAIAQVPTVPRYINFQGKLADTNGIPLNGTYEITFNIYSNSPVPAAENWVWGETHESVEVQRGLFSVLLGSVTNLDMSCFPFDATGATNRWLEIIVGTDVLSPTKEFVSVAYAFRTSDADMVDGYHASMFAQTNSTWASNWNETWNWGDHATNMYVQTNSAWVTNWNETWNWGDHTTNMYVQTNSTWASNWNETWSWGDHATNMYVQTNSAWVTNWNEAWSWGDHATNGYRTNEIDPQVGANMHNYVPRWDTNALNEGATGALVTGSIYDPGTGRIGLGTNDPQQTLHIATGGVMFADGSVQTTAVKCVTYNGQVPIFINGTNISLSYDDINDFELIDGELNIRTNRFVAFEVDPQVNDSIADNFIPRWDADVPQSGGTPNGQLVQGHIYDDPASGFIGIRTTAPGVALDVNGDIRSGSNSRIFLGGSDIFLRDAAGRLEIQTDNGTGSAGDHIAMLPGGGVGILTTSPRYALDVNGRIDGTYINSDNWIQGDILYDGDDGNYYVDPTDGSRLMSLRIDNRLGIGTSPDDVFHIKADNYQILLEDSDNGKKWLLGTSGEDLDLYEDYATRMTWKKGGNVGIGRTPEAKLDVNGNTIVRGFLASYNGFLAPDLVPGGPFLELVAYHGAEQRTLLVPAYAGFRVTDRGNTTYNLELRENGNLYVRNGVFPYSSDSRIKLNQEPLDYGLKQVLALEPKRFDQAHWTIDAETGDIQIHEEDTTNDFGLVAQEAYDVIPEAVSKPEDESKELWALAYDKLVPVLVKAIQEQQQQIDDLRTEVEALKK